MLKHELLEIYRSKISVHQAKAGYSYPTIRLPHTFSKLIGLPSRIYQTVHEGALAFLGCHFAYRKSPAKSRIARLDMAEVAGSNPAEPITYFNHKTQLSVSIAYAYARGER
jgi:hypothetical protein